MPQRRTRNLARYGAFAALQICYLHYKIMKPTFACHAPSNTKIHEQLHTTWICNTTRHLVIWHKLKGKPKMNLEETHSLYSSKISVTVYSQYTALYQKTWTFINTTARNSNLTLTALPHIRVWWPCQVSRYHTRQFLASYVKHLEQILFQDFHQSVCLSWDFKLS